MNNFSNYEEVISWLYQTLPMFQRVGGVAMHKDLRRTLELMEVTGNPHRQFKSLHIAGTNGKGSSAHMLTSILMESGYKTGLYTSPHLKSFTERIRIDGSEVEKTFVIDFVNLYYDEINRIQPSFFEITVAMAFAYFAQQEVDIAIVEVGMGGRLDSTNVILPEVSLITQIGWDHMQYLGNTLEEIAGEKAGIIKDDVPVVVGDLHAELREVFIRIARERNASLNFTDSWKLTGPNTQLQVWLGEEFYIKDLQPDLVGNYIKKNIPGVLQTVEILSKNFEKITQDTIKSGLENTVGNTGLKGRWQVIGEKPLTICDVGHNIDGVTEIVNQLAALEFDTLYMVWGTVSDKDVSSILEILPKNAKYYFCQPDIPRAMEAQKLYSAALEAGLEGQIVPNVMDAVREARMHAGREDVIFIGGSTFVVAEVDEL